MTLFLTVVHVLVCLILIAAVLLQRGKGAEIGAVFGGGGSSTVFGSRGAGNFLSRLTTGAAIVFFATSLSLAVLGSGHRGSVFGESPVPAEEPAPAAGGFEEVTPKSPPEQTPPAEPTAAAPAQSAAPAAAAEPTPGAAAEPAGAPEAKAGEPPAKAEAPAPPAKKPAKKPSR
ncbi:MAG: preprotein translocase subunit SecG [Deltaproteobacteria bacterium]|nr:preprotein translocase subunit SecG [Deltaproteobacteria bacterium]